MTTWMQTYKDTTELFVFNTVTTAPNYTLLKLLKLLLTHAHTRARSADRGHYLSLFRVAFPSHALIPTMAIQLHVGAKILRLIRYCRCKLQLGAPGMKSWNHSNARFFPSSSNLPPGKMRRRAIMKRPIAAKHLKCWWTVRLCCCWRCCCLQHRVLINIVACNILVLVNIVVVVVDDVVVPQVDVSCCWSLESVR